MTPEETGDLLGVCAAYDNRQVDEIGTIAWYRVLGDLPYDACEQAVVKHYATSRDWIMPADIRTAVKRIRAAQAEHDRTEALVGPALRNRDALTDPRPLRSTIREIRSRFGRPEITT